MAAGLVAGLLAASGAAVAGAGEAEKPGLDPENTIYMDLKNDCRVVIKLLPEVAPKHVARIKKLAREKFYDGIIFHRVIPGFMAQTGDPTGTGFGGSKYPDLPAEFSNIPFKRGTVGMARTMDPNSANSQFFIMFADGRFLDGKYTVWGQVVKGMACVDRIAPGEPPAKPDRIIRMRVAADADR
ncbi:MAG TPA: peptidylprolyl isomerase [Thermopetrobacter sp.]|nr:peptidylprolyl isomerase [Thermopetrobacter sp.]